MNTNGTQTQVSKCLPEVYLEVEVSNLYVLGEMFPPRYSGGESRDKVPTAVIDCINI